jgi:tripartite-type tricarboxylate transporter receptor subunit TctC
VTFAEERPSYLADTPTAVEAGYDVPVQQARAVVAPEGTPEDVIGTLRDAFRAAFETEEYQQFNEDNQLTAWEVDGDEVTATYTSKLEEYRAVIEEYGIELGEDS